MPVFSKLTPILLAGFLMLAALPVHAQDAPAGTPQTLQEVMDAQNGAPVLQDLSAPSPSAPTQDAAPTPAAPQSQGNANAGFMPEEDEQRPYVAPPAKEMAHIYGPEFCEFQAGFPEEPLIAEQCDDKDGEKKCYNQVTYTRTFGLNATIYASVICNAIDQNVKNNYDKDVMVKTLTLMSDDNLKGEYHTNFSEDEDGHYKMANLVGETMMGMSNGLYLAQMWIGEKSAMTVEMQLMGEPLEEADGMFRDILRSVKYIGNKGDNATGDHTADKAGKAPEQTEPKAKTPATPPSPTP